MTDYQMYQNMLAHPQSKNENSCVSNLPSHGYTLHHHHLDTFCSTSKANYVSFRLLPFLNMVRFVLLPVSLSHRAMHLQKDETLFETHHLTECFSNLKPQKISSNNPYV